MIMKDPYSLKRGVRPPRGWLRVAGSGLCQHRLSYDIDGFFIFVLNSAAASITFRDILWQLLRVPLFLSPLCLRIWISPFRNVFVCWSESLLSSCLHGDRFLYFLP